jgi:LysM repeat protein
MRRATILLPLGGLMGAAVMSQPSPASAATPAPTLHPVSLSPTGPVVLDTVALNRVDWSKLPAVPLAAIQAIPKAGPMTVTAVTGDTLSALAARYGVTGAQLGRFNNMADPDVLNVGQILAIPPSVYLAAPYPPPPPAPVAVSTVVAVPRAAVVPVPGSVATTDLQTTVAAPAAAAAAGAAGATGGVWSCIAQHESGGNPATNTGNGFTGAFQDTPSSWAAAGGLAYAPAAYLASYADQLLVNERLQQMQGFGAWPVSSRACGM